MSRIPSVSGLDYTKVSLAPTPQIQFTTLLNNQGDRQIVLAFIPGATDGVDCAMDAIFSSDDRLADIYFVIDDEKYLINVVSFDTKKKFQ